MTEDEKFVREHWEDAVCFGTERMRYIELNGRMWDVPGNWPTDAAAWAAAAEVTRARLEEIRQIEEEIVHVTLELDAEWFAGELRANPASWAGDNVVATVRSQCVLSRILAREASALEKLKKGLK